MDGIRCFTQTLTAHVSHVNIKHHLSLHHMRWCSVELLYILFLLNTFSSMSLCCFWSISLFLSFDSRISGFESCSDIAHEFWWDRSHRGHVLGFRTRCALDSGWKTNTFRFSFLLLFNMSDCCLFSDLLYKNKIWSSDAATNTWNWCLVLFRLQETNLFCPFFLENLKSSMKTLCEYSICYLQRFSSKCSHILCLFIYNKLV